MFKLSHEELTKTGRVIFGDWTKPDLENIEHSLNLLINSTGTNVVQKGRVISFRNTDKDRLFSAFKAAAYLGKYDDMDNTNRFLSKMVKSHHSYEPIRGETIAFLFIGVPLNIYNHLTTYSTGRYTRIAAGQRANLPHGLEVPVETKDKAGYFDRNWQRIIDVINIIGQGEEKPEVKEQLQAARSELPVGYLSPPFILEFSEEALIKSVFRQRLFEKGAQGGTIDVVSDMIDICLELDREKWETLIDYHGAHTVSWEKAMRTLRDKNYSIADVVKMKFGDINLDLIGDIPLYEILISTVGKQSRSMWDSK